MAVTNQKGFTLIEMMISLVIGVMITGAAYATYSSQQKAYYLQDQVAEMQQNLRAAFSRIAIELRMAGYDPEDSDLFSITSVKTGRIQFTRDTDEDGVIDSNEIIDLGLSTTVDADGNGLPDADSDGDGVPDFVDIGIQTGGAGGFQDIAENIQAVEFLCLNSDEAVAATSSAIRSVQISILAASPKKDKNFVNMTRYQLPAPSGQTWGPYNDNYRRRLLTLRVRCRNLGL